MSFTLCRTVKGFFLSAKAQTELGILPLGFPNLDFSIMSPATSTDTSSKLADCGCPKRELPSRPDKIPFPPTEENRANIEQWILNT